MRNFENRGSRAGTPAAEGSAGHFSKPARPFQPRGDVNDRCGGCTGSSGGGSGGTSQTMPADKNAETSASDGIIQKYTWGILNSKEKEPAKDIVRRNTKESLRPSSEKRSIEEDPEKTKDIDKKHNLGKDESLHIHAHGANNNVSGFGAKSLATEVGRRFGGIKGKSLLLHACEVGEGDYIQQFMGHLSNGNLNNLEGTKVMAPRRLHFINPGGRPQVVKKDTEDENYENNRKAGNLEKIGRGWRGFKVNNGTLTEMEDDEIFNEVRSRSKGTAGE